MRNLARRLAAGLGILVVALAVLEASAAAVLGWRERRRSGALPAPARSATYRSVSWGDDYWREWRTACRVPERLRYLGNGVWHLHAFAGRAIHIGEDGLRRTSNVSCVDTAPRIAMFGGSMLWGHGANDELTIPSLLAERFRSEGHPACMTNHGEWGATSRSALIELLSELRRPDAKPNVVLFYAGSYDVKDSLFRAAGLPGNEIDEAIRSRESRPSEGWLLQDSALARLFRPARSDAPLHGLPRAAAEAAGEEAVRVVGEIQLAVEGLASAYHFTPVFVWHPYALSVEKPLSPEERAIISRVESEFPEIAIAMRRGYEAARRHRATRFYDLSGLFAAHPETLFIDAGHLAPAGNRIVANRLYELLSARQDMPALVSYNPSDSR